MHTRAKPAAGIALPHGQKTQDEPLVLQIARDIEQDGLLPPTDQSGLIPLLWPAQPIVLATKSRLRSGEHMPSDAIDCAGSAGRMQRLSTANSRGEFTMRRVVSGKTAL